MFLFKSLKPKLGGSQIILFISDRTYPIYVLLKNNWLSMLTLIYANLFLFVSMLLFVLGNSENHFFHILYFIFKISIYKKSFKLVGKKASLVTFFLTTRYNITNILLKFFSTFLKIYVGFIMNSNHFISKIFQTQLCLNS